MAGIDFKGNPLQDNHVKCFGKSSKPPQMLTLLSTSSSRLFIIVNASVLNFKSFDAGVEYVEEKLLAIDFQEKKSSRRRLEKFPS